MMAMRLVNRFSYNEYNRVENRLYLDMPGTQSSNHHCSMWRHEYRECAVLEGGEAERSDERCFYVSCYSLTSRNCSVLM